MVTITLEKNNDGTLKKIKATGHANFSPKGSDIVCASVTILLRTTLQFLNEKNSIEINTDTKKRGNLVIEVKTYLQEASKTLIFCYDFLNTGLSQLEAEYPQHIHIKRQSFGE
ncbi:MAG: ribosomal-processing cysteine protease Prp [Treponemataceae bacterium]